MFTFMVKKTPMDDVTCEVHYKVIGCNLFKHIV